MTTPEREKLERFLNELAKHPMLGPYLRMVAGHVTAVVEHLGPDKCWPELYAVATRAIQIDAEVNHEREHATV